MFEMEPNPKCQSEDCENNAEYICTCTFPAPLLCLNHMHRDPGHNLLAIYKSVSDLDRDLIIRMSIKSKEECQALKHKAMSDCKNFILQISQATNELVNNIREVELLYDTVIKEVSMMKKVRYVGNISLIEKIIAFQSGNNDLASAYWKLPKVNLDIKFNVGQLPISLTQYLEEQSFSNSMFFFKSGTKRMVNINVKSMETSSFMVNTPDNMSMYSAWCPLPDGNVFYACGNNGSINNLVYYVNPTLKTVNKRANAPNGKQYVGVCALFKEDIYMFGGYNTSNQVTNACEKYSMPNNTWTQIQGCPSSMSYGTSLVFRDEIYLTGNNITYIYKYSVENNSYSNQYTSLQSGGYKVFCQGGGRLYIFENSRLLEYFSEWVCLTTSTPVSASYYLLSFTVRDGDWIYFLLSDNFIYRFNLIDKKIEKIDQITY